MEYKSFLVLVVVGVVMSLGVMAGDFKIQYPADTDLFTVDTLGNTTIKNMTIIDAIYAASATVVEFGDNVIEEADINFVTTCAHPNFLYISGDDLVCGGSAYNTTAELSAVTGAMVTGNTETGITVTYQSGDDTIDFVIDPAYLTSQQGNDTFIISVDMDDLAELNTQISSDLIDSAGLNLSYINLVKGTMTDAKWCVYDEASYELDCNVEPVTDTDTHMGYANIAMTNDTAIFAQDVSFTKLIDKGNFTACGNGQIMKYVGAAWTCAEDAAGAGVADYTNIALTNETNTFAETQTFAKNITLSTTSVINGSGSADSYFKIDATGNMVFVLG